MKQTAVQMLISRLPNIDWSDYYYSDILNAAICQEREQIIESYDDGCIDGYNSKGIGGEQYYNEIYK